MQFVWVNISLIYSSEIPTNSKKIQMPIIDPCTCIVNGFSYKHMCVLSVSVSGGNLQATVTIAFSELCACMVPSFDKYLQTNFYLSATEVGID